MRTRLLHSLPRGKKWQIGIVLAALLGVYGCFHSTAPEPETPEPETPLQTYKVPGRVTHMTFFPDGLRLAVGSVEVEFVPHSSSYYVPGSAHEASHVSVIDRSTGSIDTSVLHHFGFELFFTDEGAYTFATGDLNPSGPDSNQGRFPFSLLRPEDGAWIRTYYQADDNITDINVTRDGKTVVAATAFGVAGVWNLLGGELIYTFRRWERYSALSPDGQYAATGNSIVRVSDGLVVSELPNARFRSYDGHVENPHAVTPGNEYVIGPARGRIGSTDTTLAVWRLQTGEIVEILSGHTDLVREVIFTPDGSHVVSSSMDGTIKVWKVGTWELVRTIEAHRGNMWVIQVSPDGQHILSGHGNGEINVWPLE